MWINSACGAINGSCARTPEGVCAAYLPLNRGWSPEPGRPDHMESPTAGTAIPSPATRKAGALARARDHALPEARAEGARSECAIALRTDRAGIMLYGHYAGDRVGGGSRLHAERIAQWRGIAEREDPLDRDELRTAA